MDFKKIIVYVAAIFILCNISFFTGSLSTKQRLMEQHRLELNAARERAAVLTDTLEDIRTEVGEIGASLDRQRTSVADLRELIGEVRTRYEKMEELLNSSWGNYSDIRSSDICTNSSIGEKVE